MPTVVILLSDKRSGSTMFQDELCKHPDIQTVSYSPHTYLETHYWLMAACLLKRPKVLLQGGRRYYGYGSLSAIRIKLIDLIKGNVPEFVIPEDNERLVHEGWNVLCRNFSQPVFFEKSPQHPHHWAALSLMLQWAQETTEFDVRFIGLVRNPMAVMYSAQQLFTTDPFQRQFDWLQSCRNILAMKEMIGTSKFYMVRYEDLIERTQQIFGDICFFLDIDSCAHIGDKVHSKSMSKWHGDSSFTLKLDESVEQMALYFGYSKEELYNPPKTGMPLLKRIYRNVAGFLMLTKAQFYNRFFKTILLATIRRK